MILLGGVLFGLFHVYPVRMIMPAFIGVLMCWLVLQTDNMLYSCLLHFGYNTILILLSRTPAAGGGSLQAETIPSGVTGLSVIAVGVFIPFLIYLGSWLVRRVTEPRIPDFTPEKGVASLLLWILLPTAGIVLLGLIIFANIL